jgi:hypothetical protein
VKINPSIDVIGFAKFQAFLFGLLGILAGIFYSFGGLVYDITTTGTVNGGTALAFLALIGMPVIFASVGLVTGIVEALLYKLFVKYFGRIKIDY